MIGLNISIIRIIATYGTKFLSWDTAYRILIVIGTCARRMTYNLSLQKNKAIHTRKEPEPYMFMISPTSSSHIPDFLPREKSSFPTQTLNWKSENAMCQNKMMTNISQSFKGVTQTQTKLLNKDKTMNKKAEQTSNHHDGLI